MTLHLPLDKFIVCQGLEDYKCEKQVDGFLNNYCASATPSIDLVTMPTTNNITVTETVRRDEASISQTDAPIQSRITTFIATVTETTTPEQSMGARSSFNLVMDSTPLAVLGALLGLSVVLLAVVTTGWVWTCCVMKKRGEKKSPVQNRLGSIIITSSLHHLLTYKVFVVSIEWLTTLILFFQ